MPAPSSAPPVVRFAPSPTGYLHVGGARTALFNWLLARHGGGRFLLRIEDTDAARNTPEAVAAIVDGLRWLGLDWDGPVAVQSERRGAHVAAAEQLIALGHAYRAFETPDEVEAHREAARALGQQLGTSLPSRTLDPATAEARAAGGEPHTVRFRVTPGETRWADGAVGAMRWPHADLEDFVLLRSDRAPTYVLANAVDDATDGVTLVLRGDEHLVNTPKQMLVLRALGYQLPHYAHLPLILDIHGRKYSKRTGAAAVGDWAGRVLPEAMLNHLALLGWHPGGDASVFGVEELIAAFDGSRLLRKKSVFDDRRLLALHRAHATRRGGAGLAGLLDGSAPPDAVAPWIDLVLSRSSDLADLRARVADARTAPTPGTVEPAARDVLAADPELARAVAADLRSRLQLAASDGGAPWDAATARGTLDAHVAAMMAAHGAERRGAVLGILRVLLTGRMASPGVHELLAVLGPSGALERLDATAPLLATPLLEAGQEPVAAAEASRDGTAPVRSASRPRPGSPGR